jgi:hypothetical protein
MGRPLRVWVAVSALAAVSACGGAGGSAISSNPDGCSGKECNPGSGADASTGPDASGVSPGEDASADDASAPGLDGALPEATTSESGVPGTDACAGQSINSNSVVFVAPGGMDGSACGASMSAPCATIGAALASAHFMVRGSVFVAPGTYIEAVSLVAGVTVQGGWQVAGTAWTYSCDPAARSLVTIQAPSTSNIAVLADSLTAPAVLSRLTVASKASVQPGESLFGVVARGASTHLELDDVAVTARAGGDGPAGSVGMTGAAPSFSCSASDGADAIPGSIGSPAMAGVFNNAGYTASTGSTGAIGPTGHAGTAGTSGTQIRYAPCGGLCGFTLLAPYCTSSAGANGCGGGGGTGGTGGGGGGSSVALYSYAASVVVHGGTFVAGNGGHGGPGGAGGSGVGGSQGQAGSAAKCGAAICPDAGVTGTDYDAGDAGECVEITLAGGLTGGQGGTGGTGGQGGGGAGGSSYAIVGAGGATVQVDGAPPLTHGTPGTSLGNGPAGVAMDEASF